MQDVICNECGAIFTITNEKVPDALTCMCNSTQFKIAEQAIAA